MAAANEVSTDAVLSEVGDIFALKEEERRAREAFLCGWHCFASLFSGFSKSRVERRGAASAEQLAQSS